MSESIPLPFNERLDQWLLRCERSDLELREMQKLLKNAGMTMDVRKAIDSMKKSGNFPQPSDDQRLAV